MIKIGTKSHSFTPNCHGYETIVVTVKHDSKWFPLGPYFLKNELGQIFENVWQFHKVYKEVPSAHSAYSQRCKKIVWSWMPEIHVNEKGELTPEYFNWRETGLNNAFAVRYPLWNVSNLFSCYDSIRAPLYHFYNNEKLDYINARKKIYLPEYVRLVKKEPLFYELKQKLSHGKNLLIVEGDGPQSKSLDYYKSRYNVTDDFIVNKTMDATEKNIDIMLNDTKHPFGHGYCLALALQ